MSPESWWQSELEAEIRMSIPGILAKTTSFPLTNMQLPRYTWTVSILRIPGPISTPIAVPQMQPEMVVAGYQCDSQDRCKSVFLCVLALSAPFSELKSRSSPQLLSSLLLKGNLLMLSSWLIHCPSYRMWQHQMLMQPLWSYRTASSSSSASNKSSCGGYHHTVASLEMNWWTALS